MGRQRWLHDRPLRRWAALAALLLLPAVGAPSAAQAAEPSVLTWGSVSAGPSHTCALRTDASLWCWGYNDHGQLGLGSLTPRVRVNPIRVGTGNDWRGVSVGESHTCATKVDGALWCWGRGTAGVLGNGTTTDSSSPLRVGTATDWQSVSAGEFYSCGTRTGGSLWCWGDNGYGQLGDGTYETRLVPTRIGTGTPWATVSAGSTHTCATTTAAGLFCWGYNGDGQVGNGSDYPFVFAPVPVGQSVAWRTVTTSGYGHSCAVAVDGGAWCWGRNYNGELGLGDQAVRYVPARIGTDTGWSAISTGGMHSCASRTDGTLWCWGLNSSSELGQGGTTSHSSPVRVLSSVAWAQPDAGTVDSCATKVNGTLWCWGGGYTGVLGVGDQVTRVRPAYVVPTASGPPGA